MRRSDIIERPLTCNVHLPVQNHQIYVVDGRYESSSGH